MTTLGPPAKVEVLREYAERYNLRALIETGLYQGHGSGEKLTEVPMRIAIDVSPENVAKATGYTYVLYGDSGERMPDALSFLDQPCLFWLDAHMVEEYDGEQERMCPILDELDAIVAWPHADRSVVLVDDVRLFSREGWPELGEITSRLRAGLWAVETSDDILRAVPWP